LRYTPLTLPDKAIEDFAAPYFGQVNANIGLLDEMISALLKRVPYVKSGTAVKTTAAAALGLGAGGVKITHIFFKLLPYLRFTSTLCEWLLIYDAKHG